MLAITRGALAIALASLACAELPPIREGECGNAVLEPGEQCDRAVDPGLGEGTQCGAPGTPAACRYVCSAGDAGPSCPSGWGCGDEGTCAYASGVYEEAESSPWPFTATSFELEDVDGDGFDDLLGYRATAIVARFGDADGDFDTEYAYATNFQPGAPAFRDLDGDERTDVIVPVPTGVIGFLGEDDRTLFPLAYGAVDATYETRVIVLGATGPLLLTMDGMQFVDRQGTPLGPVVAYPDASGYWGLAGIEVGAGDSDGDGWPEVALGATSTYQVHVYEMDAGPLGLEIAPRAVLDLPGAIDRGTRIVDHDGDGALDVMVSLSIERPLPVGIPGAECDPPGGVAYDTVGVAAGDGAGGFALVAAEPLYDWMLLACCGEREWPLASAHVDGDGVLDHVGAYGACLATGARLAKTAPNETGVPWTEVAVSDFNRDGAPDFAAATSFLTGVDFYVGDGTGLFSRYRVDTPGSASSLRAADFDGDFVTDLAVALNSPSGTQGTAAVLFGRLQGAPEPPAAMARASFVHGVEPIRLDGDLAADLTVLATNYPDSDPGGGGPIEPVTAITFLQGNTQRSMISPFELGEPPGVVLAGRFGPDGDADSDVLAAIPFSFNSFTPRFWLLEGGPGGELTRSAARAWDLPPGEPFAVECARFVAIDLDGAGSAGDTIVAVHPASPCDAGFDGSGNPLPSQLTFWTAADEGSGVRFDITAPVDIPGELRRPSLARASDVDGDGNLDLVIVFGGTSGMLDGMSGAEPPLGGAQGGGVAVFWNDAGALDLASPAIVSVLQDADGNPLDWVAVQDAAALNADGDPDRELAILGDWGVFVADPMGPRGLGDQPAVFRLELYLYGGTLRAGDVNGDGLDDLLLGGQDVARVYLARAATP